MNCANHPDIEKVAFCRTCGKPLCATCMREVRGVVYCENCLAARLEGVQPPPPPVPAAGFVPSAAVPAGSGGGPNPTVAGILAGFFPGVGAVYAGQYAKGLAHMGIFVLMILGIIHVSGLVFGLGISFFYVYQIVDAVRTARAIQAGQPVPDPFGLARTFGTGDKSDLSRVPTGALVLIGLGIVFLLETMGFHFFNFNRVWPLILIGIGVWLFLRRWGLIGQASFDCERCRARCAMGPAVLVTLGLLFLLDTQGAISFERTWPLLLVVIGLIKVWQGSASTEGHIDQRPMGGVRPSGPVIGEVQPPSSEVKNG